MPSCLSVQNSCLLSRFKRWSFLSFLVSVFFSFSLLFYTKSSPHTLPGFNKPKPTAKLVLSGWPSGSCLRRFWYFVGLHSFFKSIKHYLIKYPLWLKYRHLYDSVIPCHRSSLWWSMTSGAYHLHLWPMHRQKPRSGTVVNTLHLIPWLSNEWSSAHLQQ